MNLQRLEALCAQKPEAYRDLPFGPWPVCYKVRGYHCPPAQQPYWNTIDLGRFPAEELSFWIDHAYETVVAKLPKKIREELDYKENAP